MNENRRFVFVCALMLCAVTAVADQRDYTFQSVDVPKAAATTVFGIGPSGDLVGTYVDMANRQHGFLLGRDELTTIDYPFAAATDARGIGPDGTIVGTFRYPGEPGLISRGYLLTPDGFFEPANYPGHISTIPQRILPDRTILGCYHDTDVMDSMRGVAMAPDGNTELDLHASMMNGGTPDGKLMVGLYTDMMTGRGRGFVVENGVISGFDYPGAIFTAAWDVNAGGAIVGTYRDQAGVFHGFLWEHGEFRSIDVPNARFTRAFGINARGDIVGNYVDQSNRTRGYVATRTAKHNQE